jgi:wyosine [tRNA(Phe)-imidazoG37] synthetase (radical SAM superfamily)
MTIGASDLENQGCVYGPVPSRRLGRSLGVDLVPFKTCTYDCIYCQLGRTTNKTMERREWVPCDSVLEQVKAKLESQPEYITLSGLGEPTLHSEIGKIIAGIRNITDTPVAVLTNGSLLWLPEVRSSLMLADLVLPSLDAGSDWLFCYVNRPHPDIQFDKMLGGLVDFRNEYSGACWLEVFLLGGVTTVEAQIDMLAYYLKMISPDKVQVNTVTRPPAEDFVEPVSESRLRAIVSQLHENAEIVTDYVTVDARENLSVRGDDILMLLEHRPCSVQDIGNGLGLHPNEAIKYVEELRARGKIEPRLQNHRLYYVKKQ